MKVDTLLLSVVKQFPSLTAAGSRLDNLKLSLGISQQVKPQLITQVREQLLQNLSSKLHLNSSNSLDYLVCEMEVNKSTF